LKDSSYGHDQRKTVPYREDRTTELVAGLKARNDADYDKPKMNPFTKLANGRSKTSIAQKYVVGTRQVTRARYFSLASGDGDCNISRIRSIWT
jgi:hypothetical protein